MSPLITQINANENNNLFDSYDSRDSLANL
jgi:hypothetical protein